MNIKEYRGAIAGFVFGIVAAFLSTLGLISLAVEMISPLLFPTAWVIRSSELNFPGMLIIALLLNAILFAAISHFVQQKTKQKNLIIYIFLGIIALVIIIIIVEYFFRGLQP